MKHALNMMVKGLKGLYKGTHALVRYGIIGSLVIIGGVTLGREFARNSGNKQLQIADAQPVTADEVKQDYVARGTDDAIKDAQIRLLHQMQDKQNDSAYKAFMTQFDTLKLNTIAEKAFAVDSIVDAQIKPASDYVLYGEKHWATDLETIEKMRGDDKNIALFKYNILGRMGVPAEKRLVSVFSMTKPIKPQYEVMVNVSDSNKDERFLLLKQDQRGDTMKLDESKYVYHVAISQDSIRYITPPFVPPAPVKK